MPPIAAIIELRVIRYAKMLVDGAMILLDATRYFVTPR